MGKHEKYVEFVNEVFDGAKKALNIKTDLELAMELDEHKVAMSQYRKGTRIINDWKLLRLVKIADMNRLDALNKILRYKSPKKDVEEVIRDIIELISPKK